MGTRGVAGSCGGEAVLASFRLQVSYLGISRHFCVVEASTIQPETATGSQITVDPCGTQTRNECSSILCEAHNLEGLIRDMLTYARLVRLWAGKRKQGDFPRSRKQKESFSCSLAVARSF